MGDPSPYSAAIWTQKTKHKIRYFTEHMRNSFVVEYKLLYKYFKKLVILISLDVIARQSDHLKNICRRS